MESPDVDLGMLKFKKALTLMFNLLGLVVVTLLFSLIRLNKVDAATNPSQIKVQVVFYYGPYYQTSSTQGLTDLAHSVETRMEEASRYHSYAGESQSQPNIDFQIIDIDILSQHAPQQGTNCNQYLPLPGTWTPTQWNATKCWGSGTANYTAMLEANNICSLVNAGTIDEVWFFGFGNGGFWEANMTGPGAYWTNGPVVEDGAVNCDRAVHVMGLNYQVPVEYAMHSFGHRMESVFLKFVGPTVYNDFLSSCGNVHFPPNRPIIPEQDYQYGNTTTVSKDCKTWNPNGVTGTNTNISCNTWGCSQLGYMDWWFKGIPGADTNLTFDDGEKFPNIWALFLREPVERLRQCGSSSKTADDVTQLSLFHAGCPEDDFIVLTASYRANAANAAVHDIALAQYGGNNMTFGCRSRSSEYATEIWYYNGANPGGANININWETGYGNTDDVVIGIKSFAGVDNSSPVTGTNCTSDNNTWNVDPVVGKNPQVTINSGSNQSVIGVVTTFTGGANKLIMDRDRDRELYHLQTMNTLASSVTRPGSTSTTLGWTGEVSWPWSAAAISIKYNRNDEIDVNFSASSQNVNIGESINFTDLSVELGEAKIIGWSWDFHNDAIEESVSQNPTFSYSKAGYYDVTLTVNTEYDSFSETFEDYILVDDIPQIVITNPNGTVGPEDTIVKNLPNVNINWTATDTDHIATIKLYYDTNNSGRDGVRINNHYGTLQFYEGYYSSTGSYIWDTSGIPAGTYYIYAEISDGLAPTQYDYSDAPIQILNNYQPTMSLIQPNGVGDIANTAYRIEWQAKDQDENPATIDLYYYTTATGGTPTLIASNIPFNNGEINPGKYSYVWNTTALANGNYYVSAVIKDNITPNVTINRRGPMVVNHSITPSVPDTIGYRVGNLWRLYFENIITAEYRRFRAGSEDPAFAPLKGDWDGDSIDELAMYSSGYWWVYETDGISSQRPFTFGPAETGWQPISGDWNGDGIDGIGLYKNGIFRLRDTANAGTTDYYFGLGLAEAGWQAVTGDWNNDGVDGIGLYKNGLWRFRNTPDSGSFNFSFNYGTTDSGAIAVAGDWNGDGTDTVGYVLGGVWRLTNGSTSSTVTTAHTINMSGLTFTPIVGKWNAGLDLTIESFALSGRNSLSMSWTDSMVGEDASIDIYLDNDNGGNDGILVAENLSEDNTTDAYNWTASGFTTGDYYVYAKITDSSGSEYIDYSENSVHLVNSVPLITSTPQVRGYANTAYNYTVTSSDADNDGRTYSLVSAPTGMTINASTGSINWTPTEPTEELVKVKVTDTIQTSSEQEFILEVESVAADFTPTGTNGLTPYAVGFSDTSTSENTEITTWSWDFNNDGTVDSTEQNPLYTYTTPGTYSVKLTVGNGTISDVETKTNLITVASMTANFSANVTSGNAPLAVNFTDTSTTTGTTITNWSWDFNNDGIVDSTAQNPSYTYTTPGTYTVKLVVGNGSLTDEEVKFDYIVANTPPVACMQVEYTTIDTYVRAGTYANNNYGTETTMYTKDGGTNYDRQSFMRFDLTGTDYTTITSAKLRLHVDDIGMGFSAQPNVRFYDVTSNTWTETGLTWNNKPTFGNTLVTWNVVDSQEKTWLDIDLTSYIQAELNGDRIVNIGTWDVNASDEEVEFDTRESTKKPFLEITGVSADCPQPMAQGTNELDRQVITSHDDGGENLEYTGSGDMSRSPAELYLTRAWGTDDFETAVRFQNITIPQGATIKSAYIEVVSNKLHGSAVNMNIYGHDIDNAPKLEYLTDDITSRAKTSAYYNWKDLGVWNLNSAQRTGDLKNVVQEIVDRGGWVSGNAMVFVINGTGDRSVYSVDGSTTYAPKLHIEYDL